VALLDGSPEDLKAIAEHQKLERMKKVYEQQVRISARFNQPPPPPPPVLRDAYPELVKTQQAVAQGHQQAKKKNPMEKVSAAGVELSVGDGGADTDSVRLDYDHLEAL
jgi:cation-transporting ATPase 13A1